MDIPYTDTLTYCSFYGVQMDEITAGNVQGFDPASVYKTYDDYASDAERYYLEYFLRDAYEYYGYDFKYYDGQPVDEEKVKELISHFDKINYYMSITTKFVFEEQLREKDKEKGIERAPELVEEEAQKALDAYMKAQDERRLSVARVFLKGLKFVNEKGQPLKMIPKLQLDPELLEQPLYR